MKTFLYRFLRIWNDINAINNNRIARRIGRRAAGRIFGKIMRGIFK